MKTKLVSIFLLLLVVSSCLRTLPDEELTMARMPYNGKEIRLSGCYTTILTQESKYIDYTFFYSNGVVLSFSDFPNIEQKNQIAEGIWNSKCYWGIFQVENNIIKVQRWDFTDDTFVRQYIVKNEKYTIEFI